MLAKHGYHVVYFLPKSLPLRSRFITLLPPAPFLHTADSPTEYWTTSKRIMAACLIAIEGYALVEQVTRICADARSRTERAFRNPELAEQLSDIFKRILGELKPLDARCKSNNFNLTTEEFNIFNRRIEAERDIMQNTLTKLQIKKAKLKNPVYRFLRALTTSNWLCEIADRAKKADDVVLEITACFAVLHSNDSLPSVIISALSKNTTAISENSASLSKATNEMEQTKDIPESKAVLRKPELRCDDCDVQCTDGAQLKAHRMGQKHHKKIELYRAFGEASLSFGIEGIRKLGSDSWECVPCREQISGEKLVLDHRETTKHRKNRNGVPNDGEKNRECVRVKETTSVPPASTDMGSVEVPKRQAKNQRSSSADATLEGLPRSPPSAPQVESLGNARRTLTTYKPGNEVPIVKQNSPSQLTSNRNVSNATSGETHVKSPATKNKIASQVKRPTTKPIPNFPCSLCNINCNSKESLNSHLASGRHQRKQNLLQTTKSRELRADRDNEGDDKNNLPCDICKISCCGPKNFQDHLRGKLHAKRSGLEGSKATAEV